MSICPALEDDLSLVARAQAGDRRAFDVLVSRHLGALRSVAWRMLGGGGDADDAFQDGVVAAWLAIATLREPGRFVPWLQQIIGRKAVDRVRSRPLHAVYDDGLGAARDGDPADRAARLDLLERVLDTMPLAQRQVWTLREGEQLSYAEIGERLQLAPSTVRGLLARARAGLRDERMERAESA